MTIAALSRRAAEHGRPPKVVLALKGALIHILVMAKAAISKTKRGKPVAAGKAPDGVVILMPAVRPDNFTYREIRKTIDLVKSKERSVEREAGSIRSGSATPK